MSSVFRLPQQLPARGLPLMLLGAMFAAVLVVADAVIDSYSDGHLLAAWIALWAISFAMLALFAGTAGKLAVSLTASIRNWQQTRTQRAWDADYLALAQRDPRIMAELQAALQRTHAARAEIDLAHGRAWVSHRPRNTLNAAYAGPRHSYLTTPLPGLPSHLQMLPG